MDILPFRSYLYGHLFCADELFQSCLLYVRGLLEDALNLKKNNEDNPSAVRLIKVGGSLPCHPYRCAETGSLNKRSSSFSTRMSITMVDCRNKVVLKSMAVNCRSQHFLDMLTDISTEVTEAHYC